MHSCVAFSPLNVRGLTSQRGTDSMRRPCGHRTRGQGVRGPAGSKSGAPTRKVAVPCRLSTCWGFVQDHYRSVLHSNNGKSSCQISPASLRLPRPRQMSHTFAAADVGARWSDSKLRSLRSRGQDGIDGTGPADLHQGRKRTRRDLGDGRGSLRYTDFSTSDCRATKNR